MQKAVERANKRLRSELQLAAARQLLARVRSLCCDPAQHSAAQASQQEGGCSPDALAAQGDGAATAAATLAAGNVNGDAPAASMRRAVLCAVDVEWWEHDDSVILELGWSLWDNVTRTHRTRWVVGTGGGRGRQRVRWSLGVAGPATMPTAVPGRHQYHALYDRTCCLHTRW